MKTVLFFGAPGSGKGTLATRFSSLFNVKVISSGDLLRKHVFEGTPLGKHIKGVLASGGLVQDALVEEVVFGELRQLSHKKANVLLDGFPRTLEQANWLTSILHSFSRDEDAIVNLDVPHSVIIKRIEDRWIHAPSGRTYNLSFNPPKVEGFDDVTGEPLTKRPDDDLETFKLRLEKFTSNTKPLLEYYQQRGKLSSFKGETSDQLFPQIKTSLSPLFSLK